MRGGRVLETQCPRTHPGEAQVSTGHTEAADCVLAIFCRVAVSAWGEILEVEEKISTATAPG